MKFSNRKNKVRWFIIIVSFFITVSILWNTYTFFNIFKEEERNKIQIWANAQKSILTASENTDVELALQIITTNKTIPLIYTDANNKILNTINIEEDICQDTIKLKGILLKMKQQNKPFKVNYDIDKYHLLYYSDSPLLNKLKYYPLALLLIIFLFGLLVFNYYKTDKLSSQNNLWAGMAKETAHQIGTPLSSLLGWAEIMKTENIDPSIVLEIEKDLVRLQNITDRFSKIGSEPVLELKDVIQETQTAYEYLKSRFENQVTFSFKAPNSPFIIQLNSVLHSWTIENLVKNAIDAMRGRGSINVEIETSEKILKIKISDTGKGIQKNQFKRIFETGFTTKKRGWGLGLSLTKRIVEEYHKGKIKVLNSEINKGTTIEIQFKKDKI